MKFFLPILVIALFCHSLLAQPATQNDSLARLKPEQRAVYYAKHLSSGALLVRLKTRDKAIAVLKQMGNNADAEKIRLQQLKENKIIAAAFRKYFTYCPVYFFYNTNTDSVLAGHIQGIFLDTNLVADPAIKLKGTFYLIAEEGDLQLSEQNGSSNSNDNNAAAIYTARTGVILMMDKKFNLVSSPFPFYTNYGSLKNFWKAVVKLNRNLNNIYSAKSNY